MSRKFICGMTLVVSAFVTSVACGRSESNAASQPLGPPVEAKTDFWRVTSSAADLAGVPLTYKVGGVSIAGKPWLFAHANSRSVFNTNAAYTNLSFEMGLDDVGGSDLGSVEYVVRCDGREAFRSAIVKAGQAPQTASVDIRGCKQLELLVTNGGDTPTNDEAYWINLRVR